MVPATGSDVFREGPREDKRSTGNKIRSRSLTNKKKLLFNSSPSVHRDKTRVQMLAKMFPHLKVLSQLFIGPTLGLDTKQRNSFLIKFGVFFTIKAKFGQYYL